MAVTAKRTISMPATLMTEIDTAARAQGKTFSGWLTETAAHRLRIEAGLRGVAEWEAENGPLTDEEREEGRAWAP